MQKILFFGALCFLFLPGRSPANVTLPALFSDHAVLQKSDKVPVWGTADPGEDVTVSIAGEKATAKADDKGLWKAVLNLSTQEAGPFELHVEGSNKIVVTDVLIGEVWICGGQSNMGFQLKPSIGGPEEVAASANPQLRFFVPEKKTSPVPLDSISGKWLVAGPDSSGTFSAVGYYVGKSIQQTMKVPVGLIGNSWGGSTIESWISQEALATDPELKTESEKVRAGIELFPEKLQDYLGKLKNWEEEYQRQGPPPADPALFAAPTVSTDDWKPVEIPGDFAKAGLPDAGAIWIRRQVAVPAARATMPLHFDQATFHDFDTVYLNGRKVMETTPDQAEGGAAAPRDYSISITPADVTNGEVTVAIRVVAPAGGAGVTGILHFNGAPLQGPWLGKAEYALPALATDARAAYPLPPARTQPLQTVASYLFNGCVQPFIPYGIRGVVWYQGESDAGWAHEYLKTFPLMIKDWRDRWGQGDFPFYFCQVTSTNPPGLVPGNSVWAELREAQTRTLAVPNTAQAIMIDLGEANDVHARDKKQQGDRLARVVLAKAYGQKIVDSGPVYDSMTVEGDSVRIHFTHADGGLVARELPATYQPRSLDPATLPLILPSPQSQLQGFAICGDDHVWKWADAKIDGDSVVVRSPDVSKPVAVRYAWADNPICNLTNGFDLPAGPFRTDSFPGATDNKHYGD